MLYINYHTTRSFPPSPDETASVANGARQYETRATEHVVARARDERLRKPVVARLSHLSCVFGDQARIPLAGVPRAAQEHVVRAEVAVDPAAPVHGLGRGVARSLRLCSAAPERP